MVRESSLGADPALLLPRARAAAQIEALGLPRNALSAVLLPEHAPATGAGPDYGPKEQAALQVALPLLASPALVARIRTVLDDGHAWATWAVTGVGTDPELVPYLLMACDVEEETFRIRPVQDRATVVRSLLPNLDLGLPNRPGEGFDLPLEAFALLLTLCDLYRRARFSAGLDHAAVPVEFSAADVDHAYQDGRASFDPRWLLPHLTAIRPDLPGSIDQGRLLPLLASAGWVEGGRDPVRLEEPALRLANELDRRLGVVSFWVAGATAEGDLAGRSSLFLRTPWSIWCFDAGCEDGNTVSGAPVDLAAAYGLLEDLLTPVGVPRALETAAGEPKEAVTVPSTRGRKATPRVVPREAGATPTTPGSGARGGRRFCPNCGQPIGSDARFCGSCGHTLT